MPVRSNRSSPGRSCGEWNSLFAGSICWCEYLFNEPLGALLHSSGDFMPCVCGGCRARPNAAGLCRAISPRGARPGTATRRAASGPSRAAPKAEGTARVLRGREIRTTPDLRALVDQAVAVRAPVFAAVAVAAARVPWFSGSLAFCSVFCFRLIATSHVRGG